MRRILFALAAAAVLALPATAASASTHRPPAARAPDTYFHGTVTRNDCTAHYDWKVGQDYYVGGVKQWGQADWETQCSPRIEMQTRVKCTTAYLTHSTAYSGDVFGLEISDRASCGLNDTRDKLQIQFDDTGGWLTLWHD
jgi:opacity protein-like surface antigen